MDASIYVYMSLCTCMYTYMNRQISTIFNISYRMKNDVITEFHLGSKSNL